jgi:hypothetical protein
MTRPATYFLAARDFGHLGWDALGMATDFGGAMDLLTEGFHNDATPADLDTVQVWHITPDAAPRDVTEELLTAIGAHLSNIYSADNFPMPFLDWADFDILDGVAA